MVLVSGEKKRTQTSVLVLHSVYIRDEREYLFQSYSLPFPMLNSHSIPNPKFSLVLFPFPSHSHRLFPFTPAPIPVLLVVSRSDNK